jgi:hypothetical protein
VTQPQEWPCKMPGLALAPAMQRCVKHHPQLRAGVLPKAGQVSGLWFTHMCVARRQDRRVAQPLQPHKAGSALSNIWLGPS